MRRDSRDTRDSVSERISVVGSRLGGCFKLSVERGDLIVELVRALRVVALRFERVNVGAEVARGFRGRVRTVVGRFPPLAGLLALDELRDGRGGAVRGDTLKLRVKAFAPRL